MSGDRTSPDTVTGYISGLPPPQRQVVEALRRLVRQEAPAAAESLKWGQPCCFRNGNICYIAAEAGQVKLGFFIGGDLRDPEKLLEGTGKKMRDIKVRTLGDIRQRAFAALVRDAAELGLRQRSGAEGCPNRWEENS